MRTRELQIVEVLLQGSEILVEVHEAHVHQVDHVCSVVWAEVGRVEHVDVVDLVHLADVEVWNFDFRLFKAGGSWEDLLCLWSKGLWDLRVTLSHWLVLVIFNDGILNQHFGILGLSSDHDLLSWLDFFDQLVVKSSTKSEGTTGTGTKDTKAKDTHTLSLRPGLRMDGTHITPAYVSLIENAMHRTDNEGLSEEDSGDDGDCDIDLS